jgi:hypothetical protein
MLALQLMLSVTAAGAAEVDFAGARIIVFGDECTDTEVFAARELSRYFRLISGRQSQMGRGQPDEPEVWLGVDPRGFPPDASDQSYELRVTQPDPARLRILGKTPIGVQYGVYSLLEKLGVGFYLGGDALPAPREKLLLPSDLSETGSPVLNIRGSLPWYNFLNSPTTWDLEDYRFFFDQMAKQKMNFVGFHSYDHEPFCAYPYDGEWRMGAPAATSMTYGWGTVRHMKTDEFGFGTGRYFPYDVFGSRSAVLAAEPAEPTPEGAIFAHRTARDDAIIRAQCVLAQGLQYASQRGIKVCVGFELHGDPTDAELRRQTDARIRHMLATYPMVSYVWFWQQEGRGGQGSEPPPPDSPLDLIVRRHRSTFEYLGNDGRIAEAARMTAWVQFAHRVVRRFRPDVRVIVSGWGGDKWMRFTDFYLGLDKALSEDIIFAALDNIDPTAEPNVSAVYGQLSPERERWPIPWFESDGGGTRRDQWGPQCNVRPFTHLVRDALNKGCQGLLGIHWQTRQIEEVAAYVSQFAWNPDMTYEQFYADFARKCYGQEHGPRMAEIHVQLESLGPRWTGGAGQVECGRFSWFSDARRPEPENVRTLLQTVRELGEIETETACQSGRLRYLLSTIDFLVAYEAAASALAPGGPIEEVLVRAEAAKQAGDETTAEKLALHALAQIEGLPLERAMQAYTARLTSQGDFGNLATINVKAYAAFLQTWERAEAVLGREQPLPRSSIEPGPPALVLKFPPSAVPQGAPVPVLAVAFGHPPVSEVLLHFRTPGRPWQQKTMESSGEGRFWASIPASAVGSEGVEFYVIARAVHGSQEFNTWLPAGGASSPFALSALPHFGPPLHGPYLHRDVAMAALGGTEGASGVLRATALPATEYEECSVEARLNGAVHQGTALYPLGIFPLPPAMLSQPKLRATCRATDAQGRTAIASAVFGAPVQPPPAPGGVSVEMVAPFLARLTWEDVPCAHFEVHRSMKHPFTPSEETLLAEWPWTTFDDIVTPNTTYDYAVIAVDDAGQRGEAAFSPQLPVGDFPLAKAPGHVKATPGPGRVTLTWEKPAGPVKGYAAFMLVGGDVWQRVSGEAPLVRTQFIVGGLDEQTERRFQVRCVDRGGRLGEASAEIRATPLPVPREPVIATGFDSMKAETGQQGKLAGKAALENSVLDVRQGGWIAYPRENMLQLSGPITVEFWANIDRVEGIPVMLSFGHWEGPGYWVQLIGGKIRWYLPVQKHLDVPAPSTGEWHHICCTYDGLVSRVYVDGKPAGSREIGSIDLTPWGGELRIGQYSDIDDQFQTLGQIDDVRIYQRALSAEEIANSFGVGRQ